MKFITTFILMLLAPPLHAESYVYDYRSVGASFHYVSDPEPLAGNYIENYLGFYGDIESCPSPYGPVCDMQLNGQVREVVSGYDADVNNVVYRFLIVSALDGNAYFSGFAGTDFTTLGTFASISGTQASLTISLGSAVPESPAWAMMIGGLALIGGLMRGRLVASRPTLQRTL